jgi:hypothetical protein
MHGLDDEEEALGHCENCLYVKKARVAASEKAKAKAESWSWCYYCRGEGRIGRRQFRELRIEDFRVLSQWFTLLGELSLVLRTRNTPLLQFRRNRFLSATQALSTHKQCQALK